MPRVSSREMERRFAMIPDLWNEGYRTSIDMHNVVQEDWGNITLVTFRNRYWKPFLKQHDYNWKTILESHIDEAAEVIISDLRATGNYKQHQKAIEHLMKYTGNEKTQVEVTGKLDMSGTVIYPANIDNEQQG